MANLKEVRSRISSVISTQQITKAMKMVAAAKLRRSQDRIIQMRPYAQHLSQILFNVSADLENTQELNPYAIQRQADKILLIPITSDRGLCGAFNMNIIKATNVLLETTYRDQYEKGNVTVLPIGKQGFDFFNKSRKRINLISEYAHLFSTPSYEEIKKVADFSMKAFLMNQFDRVEIIYNEFKNVATQIIKVNQLLPLTQQRIEQKQVANFIFEPSQEKIYQQLIPESLRTNFYRAFLESAASEQGARMTAMDKATDNAGELLKELRLAYNRTRQAAITKEILEIVGGAEALSAK